MAGYSVVTESVLKGVTRIVNVREDRDWAALREQVERWSNDAWHRGGMNERLDNKSVASCCVSYRHDEWRLRQSKGDTMNNSQSGRL